MPRGPGVKGSNCQGVQVLMGPGAKSLRCQRFQMPKVLGTKVCLKDTSTSYTSKLYKQSSTDRTFLEFCLSVTRMSEIGLFSFWQQLVYFGELMPKELL